MARPHIGDIVKIERDEQRYPPRGTWTRYRGRFGTVVGYNREAAEIAVAFKPTWRGDNDKLCYQGSDTTWFQPHELTKVDPMLARAAGVHPDDK